ncbi:MAG TPA: type VI secretion system baseplate subunit TssK [Gemmatimonadales bacterium]|nr:type VI secretion system baseplate subunit TssK [Gemmatimonadales bacterium]
MRPLTKVVWQEGMHLAQHHFQLQSRYCEDSIAFALSQVFFRAYGLAGCELDREALRNGTVSVIHARGVLPDGLAFHFPDADPAPAPRQIRDLFPPTEDRRVVYLGIPAYRPGRANCVLEDGPDGDLRFVAETQVLTDDTTGEDEKPVILGRKNLRLLVESELRDDLVTVPLARVRRDGAGQFVYDLDFIPPVLELGASAGLMERLRRVIDILEAKSEALVGERRGAAGDLAAYASREVASFWLAHAVHSSLAPLRHLREVRHAHPEQLYAELARLAGALCTFALDSHPRDLPSYDHDHLEECFGALEQHIRAHLDLVLPANCVPVPLERTRKLLYTGTVKDRRLFGASNWMLGVRSTRSQAEIIEAVPRLTKICAAQLIARLVKEAYPGLALEHLATPPAAVAPRPGSQYFLIRQDGPCWEAIVTSGQLGIYVPEALAEAELELLVLLESAPGRS